MGSKIVISLSTDYLWRAIMTISDRIFSLLEEKNMTQKEFGERTGIARSTISDWKKRGTNPVSEKLLIISDVLDVSPLELLSGADKVGNRSNDSEVVVVYKETREGRILDSYLRMNARDRALVEGFISAIEKKS